MELGNGAYSFVFKYEVRAVKQSMTSQTLNRSHYVVHGASGQFNINVDEARLWLVE